MKVSLKRDLQQRADVLRTRLEEEEQQKHTLRESGRHALELADSILQSVEHSIDSGDAPLSARQPRAAAFNPLPPVSRPDTSGT